MLLRGLSAQKYRETVVEAVQAFGVSPSAVSQHPIEIYTKGGYEKAGTTVTFE